MLSALRHPSIIRILGYALPAGAGAGAGAAADVDLAEMLQVCLVYELAPERGLDSYLTNDAKAVLLAWDDRIRLLVQVGIDLDAFFLWAIYLFFNVWFFFMFISICCGFFVLMVCLPSTMFAPPPPRLQAVEAL